MQNKNEKNETKEINLLEYIGWIESFTDKEKYFSTNSNYINKSRISEDKQNILKIKALYKRINSYAKENYIYPKTTKKGQYYSIEHEGTGYQIGYEEKKEGKTFYCIRKEQPDTDSLAFKHIISTVKLPKTMIIEEKLQELEEYILQLEQNDIPVNEISKTTEKVLKKIYNQKRK